MPYVVPFDPGAYRRPARLRRELGYGTGYPLYVAAVGGTAVGRRPARADRRGVRAGAQRGAGRADGDGDRAAAGPRGAPGRGGDGGSAVSVDSLFEHLACADVAVVQGGLSTTMELTAARRPFVYFPLAHHWEQQHFVAHRLDHYGAGIRDGLRVHDTPELAAAMMAARLPVRPAYRPVRRGGADKAAELSGERAHRLTYGQLPHPSTWAPSVPIAASRPSGSTLAAGARSATVAVAWARCRHASSGLVLVRLFGAAVGDDPETGHREDECGRQHHQ